MSKGSGWSAGVAVTGEPSRKAENTSNWASDGMACLGDVAVVSAEKVAEIPFEPCVVSVES